MKPNESTPVGRPRQFRFDGTDGISLVGDVRGSSEAPAVVFLHGGGQTRHSWGGTAKAVATRGWQAVTVDLRGHGESDWSGIGDYRIQSFAGDVLALVAGLPEGPVLVGASLGGLTALLLAGEISPGVASAVVLVDIVPNMEPAGAARILSFMNDHTDEGFASLEEASEAIASYNPHRGKPTDLEGLRKNLRLRDGRWYWHWDPAFLAGRGTHPPSEALDVDRLYAATGRIAADRVPILLVRGRMSDLVSIEGAEEFLGRFPWVEFVDVSGAGHMVAGDRNDIFTEAVLDFLAKRVTLPA